jgi:hypothetical protein
MAYPGLWGEANVFHLGGQNYDGGDPPRGPFEHALWRDPVRVPSTWPVG